MCKCIFRATLVKRAKSWAFLNLLTFCVSPPTHPFNFLCNQLQQLTHSQALHCQLQRQSEIYLYVFLCVCVCALFWPTGNCVFAANVLNLTFHRFLAAAVSLHLIDFSLFSHTYSHTHIYVVSSELGAWKRLNIAFSGFQA